jgi:hypothetical protein
MRENSQHERIWTGPPRAIEGARAAIEFSADLKEFNKAVKYLLAGTSRTEQDSLEMVDLNARAPEVELVTTGVSSPFPADVKSSGYARVPLPVFERISRAIRGLQDDSIQVLVQIGTIKVGKLSFLHPEISLRLIGARVADLPIDAPLPDVLALQARFRPEEIEDSGLVAKVLEAQEQASKLIDQAFMSLEQLGVGRASLGAFVSEQIAARAQKK